MNVVREVYDSPWEFTLYETDECFILNVDFCNSFVDFTRSYKVTGEESKLDFNGIKQLAELIRKDHESFKNREIIPVVTM